MDLCEDGGTLYAEDHRLNWRHQLGSGVYPCNTTGCNSQVYLDAALEMEERKNPAREVVPAGIFYYNIQDPWWRRRKP